MDFNFEISQIDIYDTVKEEQFITVLPLARKYKLKLPPHESLITFVTLRRALALTKSIFKRAQIDKQFLQALSVNYFLTTSCQNIMPQSILS